MLTFHLQVGFAERIETVLRQSLDVAADAQVEAEPVIEDSEETTPEEESQDETVVEETHTEL